MFEKETVEVTCPKCGHRSKRTSVRLQKRWLYLARVWFRTLDAKQLAARALNEAEGGVEKFLKGEIAKLKKRLGFWISVQAVLLASVVILPVSVILSSSLNSRRSNRVPFSITSRTKGQGLPPQNLPRWAIPI